MKLFATITAAVAILLISGTVSANGLINTVGVVTEESKSYDGFETLVELSVAAPLGNFTHDFSALGVEIWSVTWEAPAGKQIEVTSPLGFEPGYLAFEFFADGGSFGAGSHVDPSATIVHDFDVEPTFLDTYNMALSGPPSTSAEAGVFYIQLTPGQTHRLTSMTISTTVPADYDVDIDTAITSFHIFAGAEASTTGLPDPGQWLRLVPIPEPATLALLLIGGLALLRRKHS